MPRKTVIATVLLMATALARANAPGDTEAAAETLRAGEISFENSGAPAAQKPFLAGLALLHDFEYDRAAQAFREAQAADPGFAMAYWGEAMSYNHPVWMEQDASAARAALGKLAPTPEARQARAATPRERAYLAALEVLYGEGTKEERDFRYADAMAALHAKYPDDVDATAFYALALLGTCHEGRDFATYMRAAALLEEVFPTHLQHPGVLHYLIHSYDDPIHAPLGLRAATRYGAVAPDAPHALHMTSHIFLALGMWDEVIAANTQAIAAGRAIAARQGRTPGGCGHYSTWLFYGYLQEGRDADARSSLGRCRESAAAAPPLAMPASFDPDESAVGSYVYMTLLDAVETGSKASLLRPAGSDANYAAPDFLAAYRDAVAALRANDVADLTTAVADLSARSVPLLAQLEAEGATQADRSTVAVIVDEMQAAARVRAGEREAGLAALRAAAERESALPMAFGPPIIALPGWELLGEELLRTQQPAAAAQAFRNALARAPGRTRSLEGLLKSQALTGTSQAATKLELARYPRGM